MTNKYVRRIVNGIVISLAIIVLWYNYININNKEQYIEVFDRKIIVVNEYQEQQGIEKNDVIIGRKSEEGYEIDNIIIVRLNNTIYFKRVVEKTDEGYITRGDGNYREDAMPITSEQIEGKVIHKISNFGWFLNVIKSRIFSVFVIIILVLIFTYNNHIYKRRVRRRLKKTHGSE